MIAIYGGSFDPIHIGHMMVAIECYHKVKDIEKIIFLPTYDSSFYKHKNIFSFEERFQMIKGSISNYDFLEVSDAEKNLSGYTIDSLTYFKNIYKEKQIIFITGYDNFYQLHKWKYIDKILDSFKILLITYDNHLVTKNDIVKKFPKYVDSFIICHLSIDLNIRSTKIRNFLDKNIPIDFLVTPFVFDFINHKN